MNQMPMVLVRQTSTATQWNIDGLENGSLAQRHLGRGFGMKKC